MNFWGFETKQTESVEKAKPTSFPYLISSSWTGGAASDEGFTLVSLCTDTDGTGKLHQCLDRGEERLSLHELPSPGYIVQSYLDNKTACTHQDSGGPLQSLE